ncbi:MAG: hypothetical protein K2J16_03700 [Clostridia bacterium]|nr:hypothetical protein [Clostridia bacterium]
MCWFFSKKKAKNVEPYIEPRVEQKESNLATQEVKEAPKFERFLLTVETANARQIPDPSAEDIQNAVRAICVNEEDFLILEGKQEINGVTFMQATGYDRSDNTIYMEVQRKEAGANGAVGRNYGMMVSVATLVKTLIDYTAGITPNNLEDWDFSGEF